MSPSTPGTDRVTFVGAVVSSTIQAGSSESEAQSFTFDDDDAHPPFTHESAVNDERRWIGSRSHVNREAPATDCERTGSVT